MRRAACGNDDRFRAEDIEVARADVEAHSAGYPVLLALVHQQVRDHDAVVDLGSGLSRSLRNDRLVAFTMNHDLPLAFALIPARFRVLHHRQTPFVEHVHGRIDMPGDVVAQVLTHEAHQVVARIADMVLGLVLVPLHAHVAVDRIQALRDGAAAFDIGLLDAHDFEVAAPVARFIGGTTAGHTTADDENIGIYKSGFSA